MCGHTDRDPVRPASRQQGGTVPGARSTAVFVQNPRMILHPWALLQFLQAKRKGNIPDAKHPRTLDPSCQPCRDAGTPEKTPVSILMYK